MAAITKRVISRLIEQSMDQLGVIKFMSYLACDVSCILVIHIRYTYWSVRDWKKNIKLVLHHK